jgi:outer membrane immunogenic protein
MKLFLSAPAAGALTLALLSSVAQAQSLPASSADYFTPVEQWSGFYAGAHGGIVESDKLPNLFGSTKSFTGGLVLGADMQVGSLVFGGMLEANYGRDYNHAMGGGAQLKQTWSGAAKVRAGLAIDQLLVYGMAGYGVARLEPGTGVTSGAVNAGGLVFGGGVEYAVTEELTLKLEYQQARYGNVAFTSGGLAQTKDLIDHSIRAGINFRF